MTADTENTGFAAPGHDHRVCIGDALAQARRICAEQGARLTELRSLVLELVWSSHVPIGAYDILERMNAAGRKMAPISVYRALDFLIKYRLVHRLSTLNAFVGCGHPDSAHNAKFLICADCDAVAELEDQAIDGAIAKGAAAAGFAVDAPVVEILGRCPACRS